MKRALRPGPCGALGPIVARPGHGELFAVASRDGHDATALAMQCRALSEEVVELLEVGPEMHTHGRPGQIGSATGFPCQCPRPEWLPKGS
eukprot:9924511-Lingulodinium_polyedra.AAC.1